MELETGTNISIILLKNPVSKAVPSYLSYWLEYCLYCLLKHSSLISAEIEKACKDSASEKKWVERTNCHSKYRNVNLDCILLHWGRQKSSASTAVNQTLLTNSTPIPKDFLTGSRKLTYVSWNKHTVQS